MAVITLEDGRISDSFAITMHGQTYTDAIVMEPDEYNALTPEEIEAMKQARFDNWYAIITADWQE